MKREIVTIVVTYNRLELLKENINALLNQSFKHDIMIIDNASTDGTYDYIKSIRNNRLLYFNTGKNIGGAGGFAYGLEKALNLKYKYAWIMDDDSIPEPDALLSLIRKTENIDNDFSFFASLVYWTDGKIFPMNLPSFDFSRKINLDFDNIRKNKIIPIETCSFVGCYINLSYVYEIGLPITEFFIYGDDVEYTMRLRQKAKAYLDLDSVIIHKSPNNKGAEIAHASEDRINRFYYQARNGVYIARKHHMFKKDFMETTKNLGRIILKAKNHKIKRILVLIKGKISGLFFNPKIKYVEWDKSDDNI